MASLKDNAPQFETENTNDNDNAKDIQMTTIAPAATTAIVTAPAGALTTPLKFQPVLQECNGALDTATVEALSMATPRIKGEQGSLFKGNDDLGSKMTFQIISFNPRWVIGLGEDSDESAELIRFSYDNQRTTHGELITDYVEMLKAKGYTKSKISQYTDVFGFILSSEKGGEGSPTELVNLQCSPTSTGAFTAYLTTMAILKSRGIGTVSDIISVHAEKRTKGNNKFTNFSFHSA